MSDDDDKVKLQMRLHLCCASSWRSEPRGTERNATSISASLGESAILTSNTITNNKSKKPTTQNKEESSSPEEKPIKFQQFQYSDLVVATNGFSEQKLLGKGSHGCVYKAVLRNGRLVAVKRPSRSSSSNLRPTTSTPSSSDYIANEVDNEIDILSKIQSPRLVNLVGFTTDSRDRLLVVEFMSNGTLYDVIHSSPRLPNNWGRRIRLALQLGSKYISSYLYLMNTGVFR